VFLLEAFELKSGYSNFGVFCSLVYLPLALANGLRSTKRTGFSPQMKD